MRIKMLTTMAGPGGVTPSGAVIVVSDARAKELIDGRYAVAYEPALATEDIPEAENAEWDEENADAPPAPENAVARPRTRGR